MTGPLKTHDETTAYLVSKRARATSELDSRQRDQRPAKQAAVQLEMHGSHPVILLFTAGRHNMVVL